MMGEQAVAISQKQSLSAEECDRYILIYNHLLSFSIHVEKSFPEIQTQQYLDDSHQILSSKISEHSKNISISNDVLVVARSLVDMKFLAENLPMYKIIFNSSIDEALRNYKVRLGSLKTLSIAIKKIDSVIGARLMAEHRIFN